MIREWWRRLFPPHPGRHQGGRHHKTPGAGVPVPVPGGHSPRTSGEWPLTPVRIAGARPPGRGSHPYAAGMSAEAGRRTRPMWATTVPTLAERAAARRRLDVLGTL